MTSFKRLLAGSALVVSLVLSAAPAVGAPEAPNVHPWLLALSDMPIGWSVTTPTAPTRAGCFALGATLLAEHPGSSGKVAYVEGQAAPFVSELLASWPTSSEASHAYGLATGHTNGCHQFKSQGEVATLEPMNLGRYGDLSSAYQLTATVSGIALANDLLVVLKGRAVAEVEYGAIGTPPVAKVLALLDLAVGKIKG